VGSKSRPFFADGREEGTMIAVMGATGHTGKEITRRLLDAGEKVRALARSESHLWDLRAAGAETMAGDANDAGFLTRAFSGADAVYTLLPPDPQANDYRAEQEHEGESIVEAIRRASVRYVVFLSSVGAEQPSGTGPITGLHAQEARLRSLKEANVLALRAGYFFENFYAMLGLIRQQGITGGAGAPGVEIPMIAARDIGAVAAEALRARDWKGWVVRELLGPRDLSYAEATRILGERLGKPELRYVQFPYADTVKALEQLGLSRNVASLYVEMARAFNEGTIKPVFGRKQAAPTPTRFEEFADEFVRTYRAA
jgi:uncharacterized protein YbjT (DUF2867 family)